MGVCTALALTLAGALRQAPPTPPAATAQPPAVAQGASAQRAPRGSITPAGADDAMAMAILGQLVGSWSVAGNATASDGTVSGPFQGEAQFGWTLGGHFLSGDHVLWNGSGAALQTIDVMGFTPSIGYTRSEITNGDRSMFLSTGMYDDAARALTFVTSNALLNSNGMKRSLDTTFFFQLDGTVLWKTTFEENDQPAGSVSLVMTQTSKNPGLSSPQTPFGAPMIAQQGAQEAAPTGASGAARTGGAGNAGGSFIVQTPQGMAITRPPATMAENQQLLSAMMKQRQQMQAQMNAMQSQVQDMSRSFTQTVGTSDWRGR